MQAAARGWRDDGDLRGAWVMIENVPQGQELAVLAEQLSQQGAVTTRPRCTQHLRSCVGLIQKRRVLFAQCPSLEITTCFAMRILTSVDAYAAIRVGKTAQGPSGADRDSRERR